MSANILYGPTTRPGSRKTSARTKRSRLIQRSHPLLPSQHKGFKATLERLQLERYLSGEQDGETSGWCGGQMWLAKGKLPKSWTFASARAYNDTEEQVSSVGLKKFSASIGTAKHCYVGDIETKFGQTMRSISLAGDLSRSAAFVNADYLEAMLRILGRSKNDVVEFRLSDPKVLLALDSNRELIGVIAVISSD